MMPSSGITGELYDPSLGVAANTLPCLSTQQQFEVSSSGAEKARSGTSGAPDGARSAASLRGSPAGGISGHALSGRIISRRLLAYSSESIASIGTSMTRG